MTERRPTAVPDPPANYGTFTPQQYPLWVLLIDVEGWDTHRIDPVIGWVVNAKGDRSPVIATAYHSEPLEPGDVVRYFDSRAEAETLAEREIEEVRASRAWYNSGPASAP